MGSAAYEGLQSPRPVPGGQPTDRFLATRATVPYYLGYHGGSMDPKGSLSAFNATKRSLADSYWPAYGALLGLIPQYVQNIRLLGELGLCFDLCLRPGVQLH